jgi:hypothetical protein
MRCMYVGYHCFTIYIYIYIYIYSVTSTKVGEVNSFFYAEFKYVLSFFLFLSEIQL